MNEDTTKFLDLLLGGEFEPANWRLLNDRESVPARSFDEKEMSEALDKAFVRKQDDHYGVFIVVNDGGHADQQITSLRACFIDADGTLMPESWPIEPSFYVIRDATHWHAYWLLDEDEPLDEFKLTQQHLASYYKTDMAVCNLSRVMRVPGYYHCKGKRVMINLEEGDTERRSSLSQLRTAHPVEKAPQVHRTIDDEIVKGGRHTAFISASAHARNAGFKEAEILAALKVMRRDRVEDPDSVLDEHLEKIAKFAGTKEAATCLNDLSMGAQAASVLRKNHHRQMLERADEIKHQHKYDPGPIPDELLHPGGMIGEMMDYIIDQSPMPQPIYALSLALSGMATCLAGRMETTGGASPALLNMNLGPTGSGKDAPIKCTRRLFMEAGYGSHLFGNVASDSGLIAYIDGCPTATCLMDEAGEVLGKVSEDKSGCLSNLIKEFMELFSSAGDPYFGKVYADTKRNVQIDYTCFNWNGSSVPESVHDAMDGASITSGFLPRVLIWRVDERGEGRDITRKPPPPNLVQKVSGWMSQYMAKPKQIPLTPEASTILTKYRKDCRAWEDEEEDVRLKNIWTRAPEKAERIALIAACSRAGGNAKLNEEDILWATALCTHITRQMIHDFFLSISDNKIEKKKKKLLSIITKAGKEGISHTFLVRNTQDLMKGERDSYLTDLLDSSLVMKHSRKVPGTRGRAPLFYWASAYYPRDMFELEKEEKKQAEEAAKEEEVAVA